MQIYRVHCVSGVGAPNHFYMKKEVTSEFPKCLHILLGKYVPAKDAQDADSFMSTEEISEAIRNHTGEHIDFKKIVEELKKIGYCYGVHGELCLMWLLKKRE